eukprot:1185182-Prymnesium_polylepis.1
MAPTFLQNALSRCPFTWVTLAYALRLNLAIASRHTLYAQISYATASDWTTGQRLAVGETVRF